MGLPKWARHLAVLVPGWCGGYAMPRTPVAMLKPAPDDNDPSWRPSVEAPTESPRCVLHPVSTSTSPRARSLARRASNRALRRPGGAALLSSFYVPPECPPHSRAHVALEEIRPPRIARSKVRGGARQGLMGSTAPPRIVAFRSRSSNALLHPTARVPLSCTSLSANGYLRLGAPPPHRFLPCSPPLSAMAPDPRLVPGASVHALDKHVKSFAERACLYGSVADSKHIPGRVLSTQRKPGAVTTTEAQKKVHHKSDHRSNTSEYHRDANTRNTHGTRRMKGGPPPREGGDSIRGARARTRKQTT